MGGFDLLANLLELRQRLAPQLICLFGGLCRGFLPHFIDLPTNPLGLLCRLATQRIRFLLRPVANPCGHFLGLLDQGALGVVEELSGLGFDFVGIAARLGAYCLGFLLTFVARLRCHFFGLLDQLLTGRTAGGSDLLLGILDRLGPGLGDLFLGFGADLTDLFLGLGADLTGLFLGFGADIVGLGPSLLRHLLHLADHRLASLGAGFFALPTRRVENRLRLLL